MTPHDAIADCRRGYLIEGVHWPHPLVSFLDDPPCEGRVFEWLTTCVSEILDQIGANTEELEESLSLARRCAMEGIDSEVIEKRAWELWQSRAKGPAQTAVAQLFFALLAYREGRENDRVSCATPLTILDRLATHERVLLERGLLEQVVSNFSRYVGL